MSIHLKIDMMLTFFSNSLTIFKFSAKSFAIICVDEKHQEINFEINMQTDKNHCTHQKNIL